jgi:hypothetical protein
MLTLAAICLNEEDFIGHWLEYHYDSFDRIVICEGAAWNYPPDRVTHGGLSRDATAQIIRDFPDSQEKIKFIQHGWSGRYVGPGTAIDPRVPAKMELRNVYAQHIESGYAFTLDIDEFLHPYYIQRLVAEMEIWPDIGAFAIPQLHLWQTTRQFITGGYADVPHFRLYRWKAGSRYLVNHNWPSGPDGALVTSVYKRPGLSLTDGRLSAPAIIHYGFCEPKQAMEEKNRYYLIRGEGDTRPWTSEFRAAALSGAVPRGCVVRPYRGFLPFRPVSS